MVGYSIHQLKPVLKFQRLSLAVTATMARIAPRLSYRMGYSLFMSPHAPKQTRFKAIQPDNRYRITSRAGNFTVYEFGDGERTALFTHGWGATAASFEHFIQPLISRGYKVVLIDNVAHGCSEGNQAHLLAFLDALELTIARYENRGQPITCLFGHALGAVAVMNLPSILLDNTRVCLFAVPVNFFDLLFNSVQRVGYSKRMLVRVFDGITADYGKTWLALTCENQLDKMHNKVLFVHDEDDHYAPLKDTRHYVSRTEASIEVTKGLGHRNILQDPEVIESVIKFCTGAHTTT